MKSSTGLSLTSSASSTIALALLLMIPLLSLNSDPNHISTLQFATIDASATKISVSGNDYVGLPDPYDYSKHKHIYYMYLLNYCSGYKHPGSDKPVIDFCSKRGNELWDILPSWTLWGVKVRPDKAASFEWLRQGPHWLYIIYLVAIVMLGLSTLGGLAMLHKWRWGRWVLLLVSAVTTCLVLSVAASCQITYGKLVARADDDDISISARLGKHVYAVIWLAAVLSLCASALSFLNFKRAANTERKRSKPKTVGFGFKDTSYKYETVKLGTEVRISSATQSREASVDRLHRKNSTDSLIAEERGRAQERPYDPFLSPGYTDIRASSASRSRSPSISRLNVGKDSV